MSQLPLGSARLVAIEDGFFDPPVDYMFPAWDAGQIDAEAAGVIADGLLHIPLGCFLIDGAAGPILVDSGGGPNDHSPEWFTTGALFEELARIGVAPADVVAVIHSHLHFDHWGGDVTAEGTSAFPNATLFLTAAELDWGRSQERVVERFLPLGDQIATLDGETELFPGITAVPSPGHTPGHLSVAVDGGDAQALILGDVSHHPLQLDQPAWGVRFDVDPEQADATRIATFDRIESRGEILAGGHWPGPGWGRVVTRDGRRRFEPIS